MSVHVIKYRKECELCNRTSPQILQAPLHPLITSRVMELIEVDYFGPLSPDPITRNKYSVILQIFHDITLIFYSTIDIVV